jgi:predicted O-methyltransferase YrrM
MNKIDIDNMVEKYKDENLESNLGWLNHTTQYDDRSARINYSFIRDRKPKVVVEFGARTGRCTHDILKALLKNGGKFIFKSYEIEDDLRPVAQKEIDRIFGDKSITIGGDITKATDLPDKIDYLFIDNYHDKVTTEWVFNTLIKKCVKGCLVQMHDVRLIGDYEAPYGGIQEEAQYLVDMHKDGTLPLEKLYWGYEYEAPIESTWWILK